MLLFMTKISRRLRPGLLGGRPRGKYVKWRGGLGFAMKSLDEASLNGNKMVFQLSVVKFPM